MLYDEIEDPASPPPADLRARYERELADVVGDVGTETAAADAGVDASAVEALVDGESPELTVEEAAAILALAEDGLGEEAILAQVRDRLLMGMTTAVLDVDAVESGLDAEMDAKEIQQKIEGRAPMTLEEYARIHHYIATEEP